jgi:hypothetical protein
MKYRNNGLVLSYCIFMMCSSTTTCSNLLYKRVLMTHDNSDFGGRARVERLLSPAGSNQDVTNDKVVRYKGPLTGLSQLDLDKDCQGTSEPSNF